MSDAVWSPAVEHRRHPFGERGVFSSLEEVCRRAKKGSVSPKVRMWAIECLDRARQTRGLKMNTEKQRAEVLLKAVQKKLWVPDPVGTEWMAGAHLMACDPKKDGVCFRGADCDELVILLAACFLGVGLNTCVVGHAYNRKKQIQHVLTTVFAGGKWYYADPSTDLPLGECVDFSRERVYSMPNSKMICDRDVCFTDPRDFNPNKNDFIGTGDFIGVDGIPEFAWVVDSAKTHDGQWLGTLGQTADEEISGAAEDAAVDAAVDNAKWPPSDEQVEKIAGAAGAAAATAACSYVGAAAAAPLCAKIGKEIAEFVTDKVIDGLKKIFVRRNDAAWRKFHTNQTRSKVRFSGDDLARDLRQIQGDAVTEIVDSLEELYVDLFGQASGSTRNDWRRALAMLGAPIEAVEGRVDTEGKPLYLPSTDPNRSWREFFEHIRPMIQTDSRGELLPVTDAVNRMIQFFWEDLSSRIDEDLRKTGDAATILAAKMSGKAAGIKAMNAANLETRFRLKSTSRLDRGSTGSKKSAWPVILGVAAVGGLAWWLA